MLNLWVSRFYDKSVSYTMKREALMSKICPFFSASGFASCAFFLVLSNSQSFDTKPLGQVETLLSCEPQTNIHYSFTPFPCTERYTFLSKTCSHGSTSCTAFHDVEEIPKQKDVLVMLTIRRENSESKLGSWLLLEMPYSIIFSSLFNR